MNIRLQKYKAGRLNGLSQYQAAIKAGYSESYAHGHSKDMETSAKLGMSRAFAMLGLTDLTMAQKALQGLEATKRYGKDGDVEDKDWATIHKFYETISIQSGRLVKNPVSVDLSNHEHFTIVIERPDDISNATNKRNTETLQADAETGSSTPIIDLS